ncbi:MAG: ATP-binding protein, partial [bacterium]|nr:ATP-binding protein [bacterium]
MKEKGEKINWSHLVQRESARVEWKENVANPMNVVKTLSAFANDFQQVGGGRVLCGLKEEKNQWNEPVAKVVGLDEKRFKEIRNKVLDYCHRYVEPPITPAVSEYPVENDPSRRILVFAITSSQYAHRYKTKTSDVNYYIRVNDQTRPADGLIPQLLERKQIWPPYLDQTHPQAALDAIDLMAVKEFLGRFDLPRPVEEYLEPGTRFRGDILDLVTYPPGRTNPEVPRNFTVLLFGREPHVFFRGAYAIFSVYMGKDKASNRSQRFELFGPIPALIRSLMTRLQIYMGMDIDSSEDMLTGNPNR